MFRIGKRGCAVVALLAASGLGFAHASDDNMAGDWGHRDKCKFSHSATVSVAASGGNYTGQWSDGTNVDGDSGTFKGVMRDGKLYVRFCSEQGEQGGFKKCPTYASADDAYLVPEGKDLVWYNRSGTAPENSFVKYVVLHRAIQGKPVAMETHCPADSD
jgi:hypothetical protein